MGCGCGGGGAKAAMKSVQMYTIEGDPEAREYLTEREAMTASDTRNLDGAVVPVAGSK